MLNLKIIRNAIQCLKCEKLIISAHVHDFRDCTCGAVAVDGGPEYLRRLGNRSDWIEACMFDASSAQEPADLVGKFLVFGPQGKSNPAVAFDREEDAQTSCALLADKTGQKLWYIAKLSLP